MNKLFLILFLVTMGCGTITHSFDSSYPSPAKQEWSQGEAQRLSKIYGTDPHLYTRFLDIKTLDNGFAAWYDGFRVTICLRDDYGYPITEREFHNLWHHEWLHHKRGWWGGMELGSHMNEYTSELKKLGLWED